MNTRPALPDDDADMKIATPGAKPVDASEEDVQSTLEELRRIREEGLLIKAEAVGGQMAAYAAGMREAADAGDKRARQQIWLWVFAVTEGCDECVNNPVTARTVLNAFHRRFKELCPDVYEDSGYSLALSFYYLAARSAGEPTAEIARTFAMLCGSEQDPALQQLGRDTYDRCLYCMRTLSQTLEQE